MSITKNENLEYPEEEALDVALDKAISLFPSPVATVLRTMANTFRGGIEDRRHEFLHRVAAKLNEHGDRLADLEDRLSNKEAQPQLLSATYQIFDAFIRTHVEEKKRVLVNAAANTLLNPPGDELEQNEFLEFIGMPTFNVYHVRLLRLFSKADEEYERSIAGGSLMGRIESKREECGLGASEANLRKAWDDLSSRKYLDGGGLSTFMSPGGAAAKRTTDLGDRFLAFIDK